MLYAGMHLLLLQRLSIITEAELLLQPRPGALPAGTAAFKLRASTIASCCAAKHHIMLVSCCVRTCGCSIINDSCRELIKWIKLEASRPMPPVMQVSFRDKTPLAALNCLCLGCPKAMAS